MNKISTSLCFLPIFSDHDVLDFILIEDEVHSRIFRSAHEVKQALDRAGILISGYEERIDELNYGVVCEISVSESKKNQFYESLEGDLPLFPYERSGAKTRTRHGKARAN